MEYGKKLPFTIGLSESSLQIINHLDTYGRFRYLESSFFIYGPRLVQLDKAVWEIRRYCQVLNWDMPISLHGVKKNMLALNLNRVEMAAQRPPTEFKISAGQLEKIVSKQDHPARKALVWQNAFFGRRARKVVKMTVHTEGTNAPLSLHPEIVDEVLNYVFLPQEVITAYKKALKN